MPGDFVSLAGIALGITIFWAFPEAMRKDTIKKRQYRGPKTGIYREKKPKTIKEKILTCAYGFNMGWINCCYPCRGKDEKKVYNNIITLSDDNSGPKE